MKKHKILSGKPENIITEDAGKVKVISNAPSVENQTLGSYYIYVPFTRKWNNGKRRNSWVLDDLTTMIHHDDNLLNVL